MKKVGKLFFVICLVIGLWSLGFSKASAAFCTCSPACDITGNDCPDKVAICVVGATGSCTSCKCPNYPDPTNTPYPPPPTSPPTNSCCVGPTYCEPYNSYTSCSGVTGCSWSCGIPAPTNTQSNCCVGPSSCSGSSYPGCISQTNCSWTCIVPGPTITPNPNSCCASTSNYPWCNSVTGTNYLSYLTCKQTYTCQWKNTCAIPKAPTPIPTPPVPRVFCVPPNGGPTNDAKAGGIWTNLGCVPYETTAFASGAMSWGLGLGGGVAFLVIIYAAFLYVASGGDPKKVQAAKELIVALIGGIALILFAVLLLNYLGVNILNLGDLGFKG